MVNKGMLLDFWGEMGFWEVYLKGKKVLWTVCVCYFLENLVNHKEVVEKYN